MQSGQYSGNKERKLYLEKQKIIHCAYCRYNRGENRKHYRRRTNRHKNINRDSIRKIEEVDDEDE